MTILVTMVCSDLRGDLASLEAIASKSRALTHTLTRLSDGGYLNPRTSVVKYIHFGQKHTADAHKAAGAAAVRPRQLLSAFRTPGGPLGGPHGRGAHVHIYSARSRPPQRSSAGAMRAARARSRGASPAARHRDASRAPPRRAGLSRSRPRRTHTRRESVVAARDAHDEAAIAAAAARPRAGRPCARRLRRLRRGLRRLPLLAAERLPRERRASARRMAVRAARAMRGGEAAKSGAGKKCCDEQARAHLDSVDDAPHRVRRRASARRGDDSCCRVAPV